MRRTRTTEPCLTPRPATSPTRAGDVVRVDFGTPARGEPGFVGPPLIVTPDDVDNELIDWLAGGVHQLIDRLSTAPDDLRCYAPLPAPSPRAMWCRRQLHETTVHRVDIELAATGQPHYPRPRRRLRLHRRAPLRREALARHCCSRRSESDQAALTVQVTRCRRSLTPYS
ncbi:MAG: maleylpyruvate isomerase N-terminal domain-containing protein [Acidimicrobiia bacterium]